MSDEGPPTKPRRPSSIAAITATELVKGWLEGAPGRSITLMSFGSDRLIAIARDGEHEWTEDQREGEDIGRLAHRAASALGQRAGG